MPVGTSLRKALEELQGSPVDFGSEPTERNSLMFESADPLVKLYNPLFEMDDTFVLQEYFLPPSQFRPWIASVKNVLTKKYNFVKLLNCTIRYVNCDDVTALAYSRNLDGSFAFVLYYRLKRSREADEELREIHSTLVEITLQNDGTFYLPYRHHYTQKQLLRAYPRVEHFFSRKCYYDPQQLFQSAWSVEYGSPFMSKTIEDIENVDYYETGKGFPLKLVDHWVARSKQFDKNYSPRVVKEYRSNSYRTLLSNPYLKQKFFGGFLKKVLNIEDPDQLHSLICKAVWDANNKDDYDIYDYVSKKLETESTGPVAMIKKAWKSVKQLDEQRKEFTRELAGILSRVGRLGALKDYVSIGDNGKIEIVNYPYILLLFQQEKWF